MGMVKLRPLIESKPLNWLGYYDKTLHNWLSPRDEDVTQNLCRSAVRERLAKCVKYKASSVLFLVFLQDSPTEVTRTWMDFDAQWLKGVPFLGPHDGRPHLGGQIPQKPFKQGAWLGNPSQVGEKWKFKYLQNWAIYSNQTLTHLCHYQIFDKHSHKWRHYNSKMADRRNLGFRKNSHNFAMDRGIWLKFRMLVQNNT